MAEIVQIESVAPVIFGVLKIVWKDGFAGVVDLRPVFAAGEAFAFLRTQPARFDSVRASEQGRKIFWLDDDGDEIDFGSDSLRKRAERQAEVLRHAS